MFLAYIDPSPIGQALGSGGSIILMVIGAALGGIALFFKRVRAFFSGLFGKILAWFKK